MNYHATLETQVCYHIYNRTINRELLFRVPTNYDFFLGKWKHYLSPYLAIYAYCLMPNHFHFLVKVKSPNLDAIHKENTQKANAFLKKEQPYHRFLESQFKRLFNSYSAAYNKMYNRYGSLFQAKFKRIAIADEAHFRYLLWYIHHNPIHHGYTTSYEDWEYSSFRAYMNQASDAFEASDALLPVATDIIFNLFKDRDDPNGKTNFDIFHQENIIGSRKASSDEILKIYGIDAIG